MTDAAQATAKPWWKGKTLWLNAITAALVAAEANTGLLQPHLPVNLYMAIAIALPAANAALRFLTSQGLK